MWQPNQPLDQTSASCDWPHCCSRRPRMYAFESPATYTRRGRPTGPGIVVVGALTVTVAGATVVDGATGASADEDARTVGGATSFGAAFARSMPIADRGGDAVTATSAS